MDQLFDHERLDVYQRSLDFYSWVCSELPTVPRGYANLRDHLRRAASSIVLNTAEGAGRYEPPDKRRFYLIARGSAVECAAVLDVLARLLIVDAKGRLEARRLLREIVAKLVALAKATERRGAGQGHGHGQAQGQKETGDL